MSLLWSRGVVLVVFVLVVCSLAGAQSFTAGDLRLSLNEKGEISALALIKGNRIITSGTGGVVLFEDKTGKEYRSLGVIDMAQTDGKVSFTHVTGMKSLKVSSELAEVNGAVVWTVFVENVSRARQLVELRLALPIKLKGQWLYWDGDWRIGRSLMGSEKKKKLGNIYPDHVRSQEWNGLCMVDEKSSVYPRKAWPVVWKVPGREEVEHPKEFGFKPYLGESFFFPTQALMKENVGISVGFAPGPYRGYATGGCQPCFGSYETLYAATKLVLSPGKKDRVPFVIYSFEPDYGHRSSVATYHRIFPEKFRLSPEANPKYKLSEMQGYIGLLHPVPGMREYVRRRNMGWQWTYTPFLHTGRWFPRSDQEVLNPKSKLLKITRKGYPPTLEGYQKFFIDGTRQTRRSVAANFYVILESLNTEIARAEYPESVAGGKFRPAGESITGEPVTVMFAAGKKFGDRSRRDIADIINVFKANGIAFDNCTGHQRHVGDDAENEPGAFFIDGKVCAKLGTVYYKAMQMIKKLDVKIDGYAPSIVANNPGDWWLAWHCDAALNEYSPLSRMFDNRSYHRPEWPEAQRYLLGSKTMVYHSGVPALKSAKYAPKDISAEEFQARGTREYIMHLLRFGVYPKVRGYEKDSKPKEVLATVPIVRQFHEVGGWRAESGMKAKTRLWLERFGDGVNSFVVIINPEEKPKTADVRFDKKIFGAHPVFAHTFGTARYTQTVDTISTKISVKLGAQDSLVLKTVALVERLPKTELVVSAAYDRTSATVNFSDSFGVASRATFARPAAALLTQLLADDKEVPLRQDGSMTIPVSAKTIAQKIQPDIVDASDPARLKDFPFVSGGRPACEVFIGAKDVKHAFDTADRLRSYFDYLFLGNQIQTWISSWGGTKVSDLPEDYRVLITPSNKAQRPNGARIIIGREALARLHDADKLQAQLAQLPQNGWTLLKADRPTLFVFGSDAERVDRAMLRILDILDDKYPDKYFGAKVDYNLARLPKPTSKPQER